MNLTLGNTKLCLDCEAFYGGRGDCPRCGSSIFHYLSNWIPLFDRQTKRVEVLYHDEV